MTGHAALYHAGRGFSVALPRRWAYGLGEGLADLQWRVSARDRHTVQANLSVIFEKPMPPDSPEVRGVFRNFGRYLVEFFRTYTAPPPTTIVEGREHLERLVRIKQGGIILSAHLGNWELGGMALSRMGLRFSAVALPHRAPGVNRFFNRQRLREGMGVIPLGPSATRACLTRIRQGEFVGILGDREFGSNGIAVRLFGRSILLPRGPALLSLRTGAPVIPVLMIREAPGHFRMFVEAPILPNRQLPASASNPAALVRQLTQTYTDTIERYIRRFPTQWLMFAPLDSLQPGDHSSDASCHLRAAAGL